MWQYTYSDELYHHGVKGMKWGVRRTPEQLGYNKSDSSVTKRVKRDYNEMSNEQFAAKYKVSKSKYAKRVEKYGDPYMNAPMARIAKKLKSTDNKNPDKPQKDRNIPTDKSNHRLALEDKFKAAGLDPKQAEIEADKRIKTEKALAVVGTLTITAAAAYAAKNHLQDKTDGVIKASETMQRIEFVGDGQLHEVFYAAKDKSDKTKYTGMLGANRMRQIGQAYTMDIGAKEDIKLAGRNKCTEVFKKLMAEDPEGAARLADRNIHGGNEAKGNIKKMYDNFNSNIVNGGDSDPFINKFFNTLKSEGYGAVRDVNDMKFSGYNAKNPLIVFGQKDNVMVKTVRELSVEEIGIALAKTGARETRKNLGKQALATLPVASLTLYADAYRKPKQKKKKKRGDASGFNEST